MMNSLLVRAAAAAALLNLTVTSPQSAAKSKQGQRKANGTAAGAEPGSAPGRYQGDRVCTPCSTWRQG